MDFSNVKFADNGKLKLLIIVGTRPEIIRLAAVINKCLRLRLERLQQIDYLAQSSLMGGRHSAVATLLAENRIDALELAVMLLALQGCNHLVNQVIDVEQLQLRRAVVHGDWQVICDIVAEGCHCRVVVWSAPLTK